MTANILTNLIVTFLTPMFLATTGGDLNQAHAAATETVNAYTARHPADLLLIGQSIALGLAVLSSISLSMAENIPINLILRLRGNAVSLHRAADKCRSALADPQQEPPLSDADLQLEQEIIAEVTRTRQRAADYQASLAHPQAPDSPVTVKAVSERRIAEPEAAPKSTSQPIPRHTPKTEDEYFRSAWSTAMADVADELTAGIANLPPAERRAAGIRANALNTTANHLIASPQPRPR
jgi:hypothetical protein